LTDAPAQGYLTRQQQIAVAGVDDLAIRSLLDRQQFFDPVGEAAQIGISSALWPLFGLPWASAAYLAAHLAARPVRAGERILEIGCGLALASLVGHRRGADVTASDCHPLAERFLNANLRLNDLAPLPYRHGHWGAATAVPRHLDGSRRRLVRGRFDLVIGSDVLYERDAEGMLAAFIGRHVRAAAEVWIVDPDRGNRVAFNHRMSALGFALEEQHLKVAAAPGTAAYKGRLLMYRRAACHDQEWPPTDY
jgi:predicted nicotinamide N-methyase